MTDIVFTRRSSSKLQTTPKLTFGRESASESRQKVDLEPLAGGADSKSGIRIPTSIAAKGSTLNTQTSRSTLQERGPCGSSSPGATAASAKRRLERWPRPATA